MDDDRRFRARIFISPEELFDMFSASGRIVPGATSPLSWWARNQFHAYLLFFETRGVNFPFYDNYNEQNYDIERSFLNASLELYTNLSDSLSEDTNKV